MQRGLGIRTAKEKIYERRLLTRQGGETSFWAIENYTEKKVRRSSEKVRLN